MYSEIFYETKTGFKRDLKRMAIAYLIVMFVVPFILYYTKIAIVKATYDSWGAIGNINWAFIIMSVTEFIFGIYFGLKAHNPYIYYGIMLLSFVIKFLVYGIISVFLWFFNFFAVILLTGHVELLLYRFVMSINAYHGIFFIPTMLCMATFFGIQIGLFIKNKKKSKKIEEMLNESRNR